MRIDRTDLKILHLLHLDGRTSYRKLASILDVSPGTIRNRINHMLSDGLVTFHTRVNHELLGFGVHAFLNLNTESTAKDDVAAELREMSETGLIATLAGPYEVLVEVYCRDVAHLLDFIDHRVRAIVGVTQVTMNLVTSTQHGNWLESLEEIDS